MRYISAQDLTEVLSERSLFELSNDSSRPGTTNQAILDKACQYAVETVDGYLRARYVLPLTSVPTLVRNICLHLARYWLYSRRPDGKGFPDNVKETHAQALKDLERIQAGKLHLGLPERGVQGDDTQPSVPRFVARASDKTDLTGY